MVNLLSGIVRIEINKRIGTGFVVSKDGLILTCAHVLGQFMPEKASVVFQSTGEEREAIVLAEGWRSVDTEDVALLRVGEALPPGVQPLPLGSSQGSEGHPLVTFGYPQSGEVEGVRGTGVILGRGARTKAGQLLLQLRSSEITEGFSGAPIWDELRQRVIGMVVIAAEMDTLGKLGETAFATPTETLQAIVPALQVSDICPYRNLEIFTEDDASIFFGRARIIDELVASLKREPRFLAVFGPSGCGKSSLVRAGLIPRLRAGKDIFGSDRWEIIVTRPTDASFQQLLTGASPLTPPTVIIVDQFEELFVSSSEGVRIEVVTELTRILEHLPRITLVIAMRNDFYSRFVQQEALVPWLTRGLVNIAPSVGSSELASMAREPAMHVGVQFEEGLTEVIVKDALATTFKESQDMGNSTVLPLLEFALTQLWERRQDGILTHEAYEGIGGVTGALKVWANNAYYSFEEKQRPLVRRLFTDLVHLGDKEQHIPDTRRRQELSLLLHVEEERTELYQIVQRLVDARLLVVSQDTESKKETVEIIHDALLWEWGLLQQWVEADRNFLLWHEELERRVGAWIKTNSAEPAKRERDKLLVGSDLTEANQWLKMHPSNLRPSEREFIQISRKRISRRRFFRWGALAAGVVLGVPTIYLLVELRQPRVIVSPFKLPYTYPGHRDVVSSVAWSPDGKRIASGSWDGTVQVWDSSTGTTLVTYTGHTRKVSNIAWSPDGKRIASASGDKTVQVWDANTGDIHVTYKGHTHIVGNVAWSPDGARLASVSTDGMIRVWDASTGKTLIPYYKRGAGDTVAWSPDGKRIALGSSDATVQIWDTSTGDILLTYASAGGAVYSVAWSPDGKHIASGGYDGPVQVWNASTGDTLLTYTGHTDEVFGVAWSLDSKRIASGGADKSVQVWDADTGCLHLTYTRHTAAVESVAWSPDGKRIASASGDKTVQVWSSEIRSNVLTYTGHTAAVESVAWSPGGKLLASASRDNTVQVWDANTGCNLLTYMGHTDTVFGVAWSPDGMRIASASFDKTVQVWNYLIGDTYVTYKGHAHAVGKVAWSPDGKRIASSGGAEDTVKVWDANSGKTLLTCNGHTNTVLDVAWSPDGARLASASWDTTVRVWDASSGNTLLTYSGHTDKLYSVAWSPDGARLASAGRDQTVRVWDASSRNTLFTYSGHTNGVLGVAWSPDGKYLASGSADKTVQVWDASSGNTLFTYTGHTNFVSSVAWSPDGKRIASASLDRTVQVWPVVLH